MTIGCSFSILADLADLVGEPGTLGVILVTEMVVVSGLCAVLANTADAFLKEVAWKPDKCQAMAP